MQDVVQVVQRWLSRVRKAENPAVVQTMRLKVSTVLVWHGSLEDSLRAAALPSTLVKLALIPATAAQQALTSKKKGKQAEGLDLR